MATRKHRGWSHGTTFDASELEADLACEEWQGDPENETAEVRRVWLGTIFGLTPSGKIYAPFACSNVAGDCPVCNGAGKVEPRTGKRVRARAEARGKAFSRRTIKRDGAARGAYVQRVQRMRNAAFRATRSTCSACDGLGSISAARDERWNEALEALADSIDAFVDYQDDSIFLAQSRDREDDEVSEEEIDEVIDYAENYERGTP